MAPIYRHAHWRRWGGTWADVVEVARLAQHVGQRSGAEQPSFEAEVRLIDGSDSFRSPDDLEAGVSPFDLANVVGVSIEVDSPGRDARIGITFDAHPIRDAVALRVRGTDRTTVDGIRGRLETRLAHGKRRLPGLLALWW